MGRGCRLKHPENATPNLDKLARSGARLTNFYTAPTCSPTRSSLLSGVDHHRAGLGTMAEAIDVNQRGKAGYEGYLSEQVIALPKILATAGYQTYMAGKWHLGLEAAHSPKARGFKRSFVLLNGGSGHFDDLGITRAKSIYREDDERVNLPKDFYSSRTYTDKIIQYLKEDEKSEKPVFAYLAYTARHWPIQAPREAIDRYKG